ncbi:mannose 6-phosphate receptor domain-containing protein [Mytilinidion resinicola]|uniref:Mannose 6-phosphate receptor domain-containing protein n=1 Tax=Mytilinidion resinicola TaxID=574789 RepID=A0A6A6Z8P6_9PEZI|nr:mannose 6-phosphate receptor domain-containing protein [Mytilinidion resinicola]KAF2817079.1 mannose 6-phosphate receptor domain-containing protein [Mytilinidion resinicola]
MRTAFLCALAALFHFYSPVGASSDKSKQAPKPCTIHSPTTDRFFDLNPIQVVLPEEGEKVHKGDRTESWHAKGYDYGANFTINFCGPVVEELNEVKDLDKSLYRNVSAFYERDGVQYAIGLENSEPVFRGRKLVLNYTGGSLCSSGHSKRALLPHNAEDLATREKYDDDDDEDKDDPGDDEPKKKPTKGSDERRKSTIISLLCEKDPLATTAIAFVAASEDECTYFFEARTSAACGGIEAAKQTLGPGGVFGVIALIAALVYLVGGCVYQRTVMHQRGWRQLPNYSMWAGIGGFIWDVVIILTSSCARLLPSRRGYSRVSLGHENGRDRGRGHRNDDENRLIDNLDEEWED